MKYYALVVRPVFQRAVIEIDVENEEERFTGAAAAAVLPDSKWKGHLSRYRYAPYAAEVWAETDCEPEEPPESLLTRDWMRYAILEANFEIDRGDVLLQPWQAAEYCARDDSHICEGWKAGLDALYKDGSSLLAQPETISDLALQNNVFAFPMRPEDMDDSD